MKFLNNIIDNEEISSNENKINYNYYKLSSKEAKKYFFYSSSLLFIIGYLFYKDIILSLIISFLSIPFSENYRKTKQNKRKEKILYEFKDMLYTMSSSISSGKQIPESLVECQKSLFIIHGENSYIGNELREINRKVRSCNEDEIKLIDEFSKRTGIQDIINFSEACNICKSTGSDLKNMIVKASILISEKMNIDKEIKSLTAQKKYESKIISAIPLCLVLFLNLTSPGYLDIMYKSLIGKIIMTISLGIMFASYKIMIMLTEVKI